MVGLAGCFGLVDLGTFRVGVWYDTGLVLILMIVLWVLIVGFI